MKLIKPSFEIIEQPSGLEGIYKIIELAGKVSHKSEDNIKEGSAKTFVDNMIKLGHLATLEFGTVYLYFEGYALDYDIGSRFDDYPQYSNLIQKYINNPYSIVTFDNKEEGNVYITTNMRVLVENNWLDDLQYICEPTKHHEKRYCIKFICDRGVSHEFVRHRKMSFMQESTRYCNYSNGRFNKEITYILPPWMDATQLGRHDSKIIRNQCKACCESVGFTSEEMTEINFLDSLATSEINYFNLLDGGWKPQQARQVLPNALKTELYMCGFASDWINFFILRNDKVHAHPQAYELAHPLHEEFIKRGYITIEAENEARKKLDEIKNIIINEQIL